MYLYLIFSQETLLKAALVLTDTSVPAVVRSPLSFMTETAMLVAVCK